MRGAWLVREVGTRGVVSEGMISEECGREEDC